MYCSRYVYRLKAMHISLPDSVDTVALFSNCTEAGTLTLH